MEETSDQPGSQPGSDDMESLGESMDEGEPESDPEEPLSDEEDTEALPKFWEGQEDDEEAAPEADEKLSAHQRRLLKVAERARRLEEENLGNKEWYMTGEAGAGALLNHACNASQSTLLVWYFMSLARGLIKEPSL